MEIAIIVNKLFQKIKETLSNTYYYATITLIQKLDMGITSKQKYRQISLRNVNLESLNRISVN